MTTKCLAAMMAVCLAACSEDKGAAPASITEVFESTPGYGEVTLKWKAPVGDPNYYYTNIVWTDNQGEQRSVQASRFAADADGITTAVADGFTDVSEVTFTLTPCNKQGTAGASNTAKGTPNTTPIDVVMASVTLLQGTDVYDGGMRVKWENPTGKNVYVDVFYENDAGRNSKITFSGTVADSGFIADPMSGDAKSFFIKTRDDRKNTTQLREQIAFVPESPLRNFMRDYQGWATVPEIQKTNPAWSVPGGTEGYGTGDKGPAIGFDNQHANGTSGDAGVVAVYDGDPATYFHSNWSITGEYPHWFIIDLGAEYVISKVAMVKRPSNTAGQIGYSVRACSEKGTNYNAATVYPKTGLDAKKNQMCETCPMWTWTDLGHTGFDQSVQDAQPFELKEKARARYVQFYFGTEDKGTGGYAMVAEVYIYGIKLDDIISGNY